MDVRSLEALKNELDRAKSVFSDMEKTTHLKKKQLKKAAALQVSTDNEVTFVHKFAADGYYKGRVLVSEGPGVNLEDTQTLFVESGLKNVIRKAD